MNRFIVDASVAIKWVLSEPFEEQAHSLLHADNELIVPDLIYAEVGNVLWKRVRFDNLSATEAERIMESLFDILVQPYPIWALIASALQIACDTQRSVYDSVYLACALEEQVPLVTADRKLYNALQNTSLKQFILWIEDL